MFIFNIFQSLSYKHLPLLIFVNLSVDFYKFHSLLIFIISFSVDFYKFHSVDFQKFSMSHFLKFLSLFILIHFFYFNKSQSLILINVNKFQI